MTNTERKKIVHKIYSLEYGLDAFDKYVDSTTLKKCLTCGNDSPVVGCFLHVSYTERLFRGYCANTTLVCGCSDPPPEASAAPNQDS